LADFDARPWIPHMAAEDKDDFLRRLADDEPGLHIALIQHLRALAGEGPVEVVPAGQRTIGDLLARAEAIKQARQEEARLKRERAHQKHLDDVALHVPQLWEQIDALIREKKAQSYDQAVALLVDLRDLAERDGQSAAFQQRIDAIYADYPRLSSLHRKLAAKRLRQT
jgi:hypothetical protein